MRKNLFYITALLCLCCGEALARSVSGSVVSGNEKLPGVIVTDGKNFTVTDRNGKFRFDADDKSDFVYVLTPTGYTAPYESGTPVFYKPASSKGKFVFDLVRTSDSKDYAFIAIADSQTATDKHFKKFCTRSIPDLIATINAEKEKFNTIGIVLGDITWDRTDYYPQFKEQFAKTGIPFYKVIGNHDHLKDSIGDWKTSSAYRDNFGPEYYAFSIGGDWFIVFDNVIYNTQKQYKESLNKKQIQWIKGLLEYIPEDAQIYVAMHCPMIKWFSKERMTGKGSDLLDALSGRKVTFLSGHTHINNNLEVAPGIMEHNVAAICGSWWITKHCSDGTPAGYKVFEKKDGELTWYYKSVGHDRDFQIEVFKPGESFIHPNAVIANVWDYDPEWSVEWLCDGKPMGAMEQVYDYSPYYIRELNAVYFDKGKKTPTYKNPKPNSHYFIAVPSQYADNVTVIVKDRFGNEYRQEIDMHDYVDVQAHRGGAGLMPENTIEAMKNALDMGVNTLELDLQISQDGQVVVSHDAYFHSRYATRPDGSEVQPGDPKEYIYTMPYSEVRKYDTGKRPSTVWPEKACLPTYKPLASDLIDFVEKYVADNGLTPVRYNIEVKSKKGKGEGKNWPEYHEFVDKCLELLLSKNLGDRLVVQSFDTRALDYMHEKYPQVVLSYLVDAKAGSFDEFMSKINFTPTWLSPHHSMVDEELCAKSRELGMKLVPWTVDTPEDIKRMIDLKVDAIISNYPDRVLKQTRGFITEDNKVK